MIGTPTTVWLLMLSGLAAASCSSGNDKAVEQDVPPEVTSPAVSVDASPSETTATSPPTNSVIGSDPAAETETAGVEGLDDVPMRIVALSSDVAEVVLALVGPERIIAVPDFNSNPAVSSNSAAASAVAHQLGFGDPVGPELLEEWGADLVLVSPNHAEEIALAEGLANSDIALLTMPNSWDTLGDAQKNILLIGEAVGAAEGAAAMVANIEERAAIVNDAVSGAADQPGVLILTNVAGPPFLIGPGVSTTDLVQRAGGVNVAMEMGVENSISVVSAEKVAAASVDYVLLIDGQGTGRDAFDPFLSDPLNGDIAALEPSRILVLPARISFGVAGALIDGLEEIARWLHPEAFE